MQSGRITLSFPLAGVDRRGGYRREVRPYAAPWAVNVRGCDSLEDRERGGSRPGLAKVSATGFGAATAMVPLSYVDSGGVLRNDLIIVGDGAFYQLRGSASTQTTGSMTTDGGVAITDETGQEIVFDATVAVSNPIGSTGRFIVTGCGSKMYLADSVLRSYDPATGLVGATVASAGAVPTAQPLMCTYRDRIVLAGKDNLWYASRQGDPTNWNFGADMGDHGRATAGALAFAGGTGKTLTAMIPVEDKVLVFACANEMWMLSGDPVTGRLNQVSSEIGVIAPQAWAIAPDGMVAFLSNDGVFLWSAGSGSHPSRFSEERIPEQLRNVSASNTITMAYDPFGRGFHLFITPATGTGSHWFLDVANKAIWPVVFQANHQPVAVSRVGSGGLAEVAMMGRDGYVRKFDRTSGADDGSTMKSHVLMGPFRIPTDDVTDAMVAELHGIMGAALTGTMTWRLVMGTSAEDVTDRAVAGVLAAVAGTAITGVAATGTWVAGRNAVTRPRARGPWAVVWIEGSGRWAYEAVAVVYRQLGRMRT